MRVTSGGCSKGRIRVPGLLPIVVLGALLSATRDPAPEIAPAHSIGHPYSGRLTGSVPLPASSPYHSTQISTRAGRIYYGTDHLVRFLLDTARQVGEKFPGGPTLSVGNLSLERGGNISVSRSHNTGRDVDLAYWVVTLDGAPVPSYYHHFGPTGRSVEAPRRFQLDLARNWGMAKIMMQSTEAEAQYIIVAPFIERMLLDYARSIGEDPETIRRANLMMTLPGYANLHDNHIHVRVLCTPADWAEKCQNGGPVWPWATAMYGALEKARHELVPGLASADPAVRKATLETLAARHVDTAAPDVAKLLADPDAAVAEAAALTLTQLITEATTQTVFEAAFSAPLKVAARLLDVALPLAGPEGLPTARAVVDGQHPAVSADVPEKARKHLASVAAKVLKSQPTMAPTQPGGP